MNDAVAQLASDSGALTSVKGLVAARGRFECLQLTFVRGAPRRPRAHPGLAMPCRAAPREPEDRPTASGPRVTAVSS